MNYRRPKVSAFGRSVREAKDDMDMQARLAIVAGRDVTDGTEYLRLLGDGDLLVALRSQRQRVSLP